MARARARIVSFLLALGVLAGASLSWPLIGAEAAAAAPPVAQARADLCTTAEWQADFRACVGKLQAVSEDEVKCRNAPTPARRTLDSPAGSPAGQTPPRNSGRRGFTATTATPATATRPTTSQAVARRRSCIRTTSSPPPWRTGSS